jgi:hypothetical protein
MQDEGSWGNVRFRPRRLRGGVDWGDAESRFVAGLIVFLLAALLYPWYEYRVQAWLATRDLQAAMQGMEKEADAAGANARAAVDAVVARQSPGPGDAARPSIRLMGAMELRNGPLAIVDLGGRALDDARPLICVRVQETLGTPMGGREVRVQRWRRNAPAVSMGVIRC